MSTIGKPDFTYLYDRPKRGISPRNIRSASSKSGLFPFDPSRALREFQAVPARDTNDDTVDHPTVSTNLCHTPNTPDHFALLRSEVEQGNQSLDDVCKLRLQTLSRATEKVFADRVFLLGGNRIPI